MGVSVQKLLKLYLKFISDIVIKAYLKFISFNAESRTLPKTYNAHIQLTLHFVAIF